MCVDGKTPVLLFFICLLGAFGCSESDPQSTSVYDLDSSDAGEDIGGNTLFCQPSEPIECGPGDESNTVILCNETGTEGIETCLLYTSPSPRDS